MGRRNVSYDYQNRNDGFKNLPVIAIIMIFAAVIGLDFLLKFNFNWVDYTIVAIVFVAALTGAIRGLIGTIISLIGYIGALICAIIFAPTVSRIIIEKTGIDNLIKGRIETQLSKLGLQTTQTINLTELENISDLAEKNNEIGNYFSENPMMQDIMERMNISNVLENSAAGATSFVEIIVATFIKIIVLILIFILAKIIISLIGRLIDSLIEQSDILSLTNKTIGAALGFVIGLFLVFLIASYVIPFMGSINVLQLPDAIASSSLLQMFN